MEAVARDEGLVRRRLEGDVVDVDDGDAEAAGDLADDRVVRADPGGLGRGSPKAEPAGVTV